MLRHYLAIALRNLRRAPFTALINVATLALGLVAFVAAYAVVAYWSHSDRHFANANRTYVITASLALRDGSISTGNMPQTNELYQKYMRLEFPEFQAIVRANAWSKTASVTADGRRARVVAVAVDPEFLDIFDLPFISGDPRTALATPDGVLLSEAAAVRLYGTRDVLGKTITLGGNRIDATVKGVIGKIPEPSHIGSSRSASLNFEMIAPWDLYDRLRQSFNTPADSAAHEQAARRVRDAGVCNGRASRPRRTSRRPTNPPHRAATRRTPRPRRGSRNSRTRTGSAATAVRPTRC